MRTSLGSQRRDVTLGLPIDRNKAERIRDLAWQQRRTVADLLRELVADALKARGIDLNEMESETTQASA